MAREVAGQPRLKRMALRNRERGNGRRTHGRSFTIRHPFGGLPMNFSCCRLARAIFGFRSSFLRRVRSMRKRKRFLAPQRAAPVQTMAPPPLLTP